MKFSSAPIFSVYSYVSLGMLAQLRLDPGDTEAVTVQVVGDLRTRVQEMAGPEETRIGMRAPVQLALVLALPAVRNDSAL